VLALIDTAGCGMEEVAEEGGDSRSNPGEARAALAHAGRLLAAGVAPADVGVITPYNAQARRPLVDLVGVWRRRALCSWARSQRARAPLAMLGRRSAERRQRHRRECAPPSAAAEPARCGAAARWPRCRRWRATSAWGALAKHSCAFVRARVLRGCPLVAAATAGTLRTPMARWPGALVRACKGFEALEGVGRWRCCASCAAARWRP